MTTPVRYIFYKRSSKSTSQFCSSATVASICLVRLLSCTSNNHAYLIYLATRRNNAVSTETLNETLHVPNLSRYVSSRYVASVAGVLRPAKSLGCHR